MKLRYLYLLLTSLFVLASCNQDEELNESIAGHKGEPFTFTPNLAVNNWNDASRTTQENYQFEDGDAIGIFAFNKINGKINYAKPVASNVKYVYNNDTKEFDPAEISTRILSTGAEMEFLVYFPYSSNCSNVASLSHSITNQDIKSNWLNADLLYCSYLNEKNSLNVPLAFSHKYATVELTIAKVDGVSSVVMNNVRTSSITDLTTGITTVKDSPTATLKMYKYAETDGNAYYRLTIPVQTFSSTSNSFIVNNRDGSSIKLQGVGSLNLSEGKISKVGLEYAKEIKVIDFLPGGTTTGSGTYRLMDECTLSATVNSGYEFIGWQYDGQDYMNNPYTFKVKDNMTFSPQYRSYGDWKISFDVSTTDIPAEGGSCAVYAKAKREVYRNGVHDSYEEKDINTLTSSNPIFTLNGNTVSAPENKETSSRSTTITANIDGVSSSIQVTQKGASIEYILKTSPESLEVENTMYIKSAKVISSKSINGTSSPLSWTCRSSVPWISCSVSSDTYVSITVQANNTSSDRNGEIIFTQSESNKEYRLPIKQKAGTVTYEFKIYQNDLTLNCTGSSLIQNSVLSSKRIGETTTSVGWSYSSTPSWLTFEKTSDGYILYADENTKSSIRTGTITLTQDESNKTLVINVTQEAGSGEITYQYGSWNTTSLTVTASPTSIGESGGSSTLKAVAGQRREKKKYINGVYDSSTYETQSVDVSSSVTWSGTASGFSRSGTLVTISANSSTSSRSCTYTGSYNGYSDHVTITQSGRAEDVITYQYGSWNTISLTVTASPTSIGESGGSSTLKAVAGQRREKKKYINGVYDSSTYETQSVDVSSSVTWSGTASGFSRSGTLVTISANSSTSSRSCTYTGSYNGYSDYVTITQSGKTVVTTTYYFSCNGSTINKNADGGSNSYSVTSYKSVGGSTSDVEWSCSTSQNWISCNKSGSSVYITIAENNSTSTRSGTVTLTQAESGKTITLSVNQGRKYEVDIQ